jgi:hypothetical protein
MPAVFGRGADLVVKLVALAALVGAALAVALIWGVPRADYRTRVGLVQPQPVPFSHKHHVGGLGIDCRYCHVAVERSAHAGMPTTETCMTCHSQVWTNATMLAPVRDSLADHRPLRWRRVHDLPDYVYFDHSIHVAKGVGCVTCHGPVDRMPLTRRAHSLTMGWCLDCHRDPAPQLRPREAVFDPEWRRGPDTPSGAALARAYGIAPASRLIECSVCHR